MSEARDDRHEVALVALSRDALIVTDHGGWIRFANPAAGEILNRPTGQLRARQLVSYVEPSHRRGFRICLNRAASGETLNFSLELAPPRMQPFPAVAWATPIKSGIGWVVRHEFETSAGRRQDAAATLERVQLGRVLEAVRDGVVVVDRDHAVHFVNRAAKAMFAPDQFRMGRPVPEPWTGAIDRLLDELFAREAYSVEAVLEPEQRTAYWVRGYQSGVGETAVLLLSDITLDERREQAERDFVAHAAHELQSPLTGISGAIEVLLSGADEDPGTRRRFLEHIERQTRRLTRLHRSLLLLSEAQALASDVELEEFELHPLLVQVGEEESDGAKVEVAAPPLRVLAHHDLVEHALTNLVSNAVRHGGGSGVSVAAGRTPAGDVEVRVTDFGPGMAADERDRAFERFYRGAQSAGEGFGLGLAIARQAVRAVGGEVELRPNPRGGTIAVLTLRGAS